VLASVGELGVIDSGTQVTFEEKAGPVVLSIRPREGQGIWCELSAPERLSLGPVISTASLAAAVSLPDDAVVTATHPPRVVSVGLPFIVAQLKDRAALERARPRMDGAEALMLKA